MKTLFYGGTILTMEDPLYAEAVLVEDGTILAAGPEQDLRSMAGDCETVPLRGATLMPGFIDAHSHFSQMASAQLQISLNGARSPQEMELRIRAFLSKENPAPGSWICARDYDNNLMPGQKNPTLAEIDAFAPRNPLVIRHKSGHMGLMNSMAMERLGITPDTPSPPGGKIEVEDGALTGYLEENGFFSYLKKIPAIPPQQLADAFVKAQEQYASYGITTIQDGMVVQEMFPLYQMLLSQRLLKLDLVAYPAPEAFESASAQFGTLSRAQHLKIGGMKIFLDGSPQGRTAWMRTPYIGETDYFAYGTLSDQQVLDAMLQAGRAKTQLIGHCNGDAAAAQFLRCLERAEEICPHLPSLRPVIIHGQLLGVDQLPDVKRLGAMVSFFVAHVYHWGDVHLRNFGFERASQISPAASALAQNIPITFHQDAPVIQPNMLETVWAAVNRRTREGVLLGEQEAVSVLDALKAVTSTAAYQYFEESSKGTIAPGKRADFVLLDRNPLEVPKNALRELLVLETYKDGVCIFRRSSQTP